MASILLNIRRICHSQFKCKYLKKENFFVNFLFHWWTLHQISNTFRKKMMVIANVFPKLQTVNLLVRPLSKNRRFRKHFDSQHVKVSQILAISSLEHIFPLFSAFWGKFIWKMSPLVLGQIFGVFVDKLPADGKYHVEYSRICDSQFKCIYLKNEKRFLNFVFDSWNLHQISNILKKKMMAIANVFPKLQTVKFLVRPFSKNCRFRKSFDSQHVKVS